MNTTKGFTVIAALCSSPIFLQPSYFADLPQTGYFLVTQEYILTYCHQTFFVFSSTTYTTNFNLEFLLNIAR